MKAGRVKVAARDCIAAAGERWHSSGAQAIVDALEERNVTKTRAYLNERRALASDIDAAIEDLERQMWHGD